MDQEQVVYVVDENLLRLGSALVAVRRDVARFSRPPVSEVLYAGIPDTEWIPIVGDRGWVVITNDQRLRTRPHEAELANTHKLKVVHLHGRVGTLPAWEQLVRLTARWEAIEQQAAVEGPWWLSARRDRAVIMSYDPGKPERA